jgi:colanic acid/amylovoran biosynthesis glycosyltransferase
VNASPTEILVRGGTKSANRPLVAVPPIMQIAYLLSEYPTLGHTYLLREVRGLRELGWDIQTVSIRQPGPRPSPLSAAEQEERDVTWYILGSSPLEFLQAHVVTFATRPGRYLRGFAAAWNIGRSHPHTPARAMAYFMEAVLAGYRLRQAGIEHVHSVYTTTVALIMTEVFDIRLSMTIHGPSEFFDPEGFRIREKVAAAELVSAISYFCRSQIMLWSAPADWHKIEVAPLGIDISGWQPATFREHPAPFELISVGRLADVKGYPLLLEAVALLAAEGRDVRLRLVGDGPDSLQLQELAGQLGIAGKVVFEGWKSQEELRYLYAGSDLCVLSSFSEGVPVVLMEAMATGVPCVAPRITGIPELIRDGVEGLLVTPANVADLAAAIGSLMDNPELRRQMAARSRERIADQYELRQNVLRLSKLFSRKIQPDHGASAPSS